MRSVLFWCAPEKYEKNAPMGEPMVPPWIPPPSDARIAGGPGLKDSYFYSNEVYSTRTGEKVA